MPSESTVRTSMPGNEWPTDPGLGPSPGPRRLANVTAMTGAGIRAQQSVDAMAVIYMLSMLVLLVIALRFVNPTQLVARVDDSKD